MNSAEDLLRSKLQEREAQGLLRKLSHHPDLIDLCSNDYLGLARKLKLSSDDLELSLGSTGSRLLTGNTPEAEELESFIAQYHKGESALLFNSGYAANLGVFSAIPQKGDTILFDELVHASIRDGIRLSYAKDLKFKHNDIGHLEYHLQEASGRAYIAVESLYSMDGDLAPLESIAQLADKYGAELIVDEAHATGIYGKRGEGRVVDLGLERSVFISLHTYGKAFGTHGAAVVCPITVREHLINFARPFIYTTALPPHALKAIRLAYDAVDEVHQDDLNISSLVEHFTMRTQDIDFGYPLPSDSPIQSWLIPSNEKVRQVAEGVRSQGYDVRAILSPTVPEGKERIRICLHEFNTIEEVDGVVNAILAQA